MAPPVLPGARWRPGRLAGYARGRTRLEIAIEHCTAGRNSYNIGLDGYFNILIPKEDPPFQFAETDALTWHAAHMNPYGPGCEVERMSAGSMHRWGLSGWEPLTRNQQYWLRAWHEHCGEHGIRPEHFIGERFQYQGFFGYANHGDVDKMRSDGITDARIDNDDEWQRTQPGVTPPTPEGPKIPKGVRVELILGPLYGQPSEPSGVVMQGGKRLHVFPAQEIVNTVIGPMPSAAAGWLGSVSGVNIVRLGSSQAAYGTQNVEIMNVVSGRMPEPVI